MLAALWWAWAAYAWLTNTLDPEEGLVRIAMFVVMAAMLIAALAVPEAFGEHGVIFGVAYLVVRAMHIALYALAARGDHDLLGAVLRMTPSSTISGVLILVRRVPRRARAQSRCGSSRSRSTTAACSSAEARVGGSRRGTSPSGTA